MISFTILSYYFLSLITILPVFLSTKSEKLQNRRHHRRHFIFFFTFYLLTLVLYMRTIY